MKKYLINGIEELTNEKISKIINDFILNVQPTLIKWGNYYAGKQKILNKTYSDATKSCSRIVTNYCKNIVDNYGGYIAGKPITYTSNSDIEDIQNCLRYNDCKAEDSQLLRNALIYGVGYEIAYIDVNKQIRFKVLDSENCIPVYDSTLDENLIAVMRFYDVNSIDNTVNPQKILEIYTDKTITTYKMGGLGASLEFVEQKTHYFKQVPVSVFNLNDDNVNIFDCIISLQDSYNELTSSEVDDYSAFCDAYLVLNGLNLNMNDKADREALRNMRENRIMVFDSEHGSAEYLTKQINDTQIQNLIKLTNDSIHKISNSPDFNDEKFLSQSGIAMKYKLTGFENAASSIESEMKKALQKRIELISAITTLTSDDISIWRDINIQFTRNLPENMLDTVSAISQLKGLISNETLISLLPFINDANSELEKIKSEQPQIMYFSNTDDSQSEDGDVVE